MGARENTRVIAKAAPSCGAYLQPMPERSLKQADGNTTMTSYWLVRAYRVSIVKNQAEVLVAIFPKRF